MSRRRWGRYFKLPGFGMCAVLLLGLCAWLLLPAGRAQTSGLQQESLPAEGWQVCADLGLGQPPGAAGNVQLLLLCTADGWEVRAFCLQPGVPAPALGTFCSRTSETVFWCGDQVQQLSLYEIQQTPPPAPTFTSTATLTPTFTVTVTPTATLTETITVTNTLPPLQATTPVPPPANAPTATHTVVPPDTEAGPTLTATVYQRPPPGGPGNLVPVLSVGAVAAGLALLSAALFTLRRR